MFCVVVVIFVILFFSFFPYFFEVLVAVCACLYIVKWCW